MVYYVNCEEVWTETSSDDLIRVNRAAILDSHAHLSSLLFSVLHDFAQLLLHNVRLNNRRVNNRATKCLTKNLLTVLSSSLCDCWEVDSAGASLPACPLSVTSFSCNPSVGTAIDPVSVFSLAGSAMLGTWQVHQPPCLFSLWENCMCQIYCRI